VDDLLAKVQESFDPDERDRILAAAHALIVDEAPFGLDRPRVEPARDVREGQRLPPGAKRVSGLYQH
jgi:hypothetical protein